MSLSVFTQIVSENNRFTIVCKENKWSYKRREWNISAYSSYSVLKQKLLSGNLKKYKKWTKLQNTENTVRSKSLTLLVIILIENLVFHYKLHYQHNFSEKLNWKINFRMSQYLIFLSIWFLLNWQPHLCYMNSSSLCQTWWLCSPAWFEMIQRASWAFIKGKTSDRLYRVTSMSQFNFSVALKS